MLKERDNKIEKMSEMLAIQKEKIRQLESSLNRLWDELYGLKDRLYDEKIL